MKLFRLHNGELELDSHEILLIKEFKVLWDRDKSSKKKQAFKEFNYMYQLCDSCSYCNIHGLSERESISYALDITELPKTFVPDKDMLAAMARYSNLNRTPLEELHRELLSTFNNSTKIVKKLREVVTNKLEDRDLNAEDLSSLISSQKDLFTIAADVPKYIKTLNESEKLLEEQRKPEEVGRGGKAVTSSMNPDESL